jgi:hypothetical protein
MKETFIAGELLQRANFAAGANDCDQIAWLNLLVNELR